MSDPFTWTEKRREEKRLRTHRGKGSAESKGETEETDSFPQTDNTIIWQLPYVSTNDPMHYLMKLH